MTPPTVTVQLIWGCGGGSSLKHLFRVSKSGRGPHESLCGYSVPIVYHVPSDDDPDGPGRCKRCVKREREGR